MNPIYNHIDAFIAEKLEVSLQEYIAKIENIKSDYRMKIIIGGIMDKDPVKFEKAKRIFNTL